LAKGFNGRGDGQEKGARLADETLEAVALVEGNGRFVLSLDEQSEDRWVAARGGVHEPSSPSIRLRLRLNGYCNETC
jgi:hypothetical protein